MCESKQPFEVKVLALKRWNQAQAGKLFDKERKQRGHYISFQSHHFIDICAVEEEPTLPCAYEQLLEGRFACADQGRKTFTNGGFQDIHMVQSMTLLGRSKGFWNSATEVMHITFIQMMDSTRWEYDKIDAELTETILKEKTKGLDWDQAEWALYYSLDFCDLVLFTKHLKLKPLNDLLWKMSLRRMKGFQNIQDTYTTSCFEAGFLENFFMKEQSGLRCDESPAWDDELAVSMDFSIRDMSAIPALLKSVSEIAGKLQSNRLSGRNDLRITTGNLTGDQVLRILYRVNALFAGEKGEPTKPFSSYEVDFLAAQWKGRYPKKKTPDSTTRFESAVRQTLETLDDACTQIASPFKEYILETLRALRELNMSGFSEEFILSVLPSFFAYIKIVKQATAFQTEATEAECERITDSLLQMHKSYFSALNTLSICTMHSERQFIHAPAFNASYFEIPPKMLAFYNAIVDHIASRLTKKKEDKYHYLITPDYRSDIYVKPLNICYKKDTERHLAIIYLPEKYFYQPEKALMLLAHEVGHYEGQRNRMKRAKCIFEIIGLSLLRHAPLYYIDNTRIPKIVRLLAKDFGAYLFEQYQQNKPESVRGIEATLEEVALFLEDVHYGLDYFSLPGYARTLAERWAKALQKNWDDQAVQQECKKVLQKFDETLHTVYFADLSDGAAVTGAVDVIARSTVHILSELLQPSNRKKFQDISETSQAVIQAFGEAFADRQMLSIVKNISPESYLHSLKDEQKDLSCARQDSTTEQLLRYNAIRQMKTDLTEDAEFVLEDLFQKEVADNIAAYLKSGEECRLNEKSAWCRADWEKDFLDATDAAKRCEIVSEVLTEYKKNILAKGQT